MSEILSWSATAASNNTAVPNGWPEGMNYSAVNDVGREMMASVARNYADTNGTVTTGGTGNAYTATSTRSIAAYATGLTLTLKFDRENTGAPTLNVNSLGAKAIKDVSGQTLRWADIRANGVYVLVYDGTGFKALNIDTGIEATGSIKLWSGSTASIPAGWRLCNGTNGTVNLDSKFIVGAGSGYAVGATGGATSYNTTSNGSHAHSTTSEGNHSHGISVHNHTLSTHQMPAHAHGLNIEGGGPQDAIPSYATGRTSAVRTGTMSTHNQGGNGAHAHSASSNTTGAHTHAIYANGAHTHGLSNVLPPYYALAFIQRTAA